MKKTFEQKSLRKIHPLFYQRHTRAQMAVKPFALKTFSTPLCKNRYQKEVVFTERCLFYRLISIPKQRINEIYRKICDLTKKVTAFLVRNRGPPSEI